MAKNQKKVKGEFIELDLRRSDIHMSINNKQYDLVIFHDLPDIHGLSINDAVDSWIYRTNDYTEESLCRYIDSKNTPFMAFPEKTFNEMIKAKILMEK